MAQIINNEIPSGVIDGMNKIFTLAYTATQVSSLIVDGAEYFNFTVSGKTLTLADAPLLSVYADYITIYSDMPAITSSNILLEIINRVYYIMGEKTTSTSYPLNELVKPMINELQEEICRGIVPDETTGKTIRAGDLRFMRKQYPIDNIPNVSVVTAVAVGDTQIFVEDTTNYPTSGDLLCLGAVVHYTGKTSNCFTGCSGIDRTLPAGTSIRFVWKLPADYSYMFNLEYVRSTTTVQMNQSPYFNNFIEYRDFRSPKDLWFYYTIIGDNTSADNLYLYINGYNGIQDKFVVHYYRDATPMFTDSSYCELPGNYGVQVIAPIVAGRILWNTEEVNKATIALKQGYKALENMYSYYGTSIKEYRQRVRTTTIPKYHNNIGNKRYIVNF